MRNVIYVFVCLFSHNVCITDAARITELDIQTFRDQSWKSVYFGFRCKGPEPQKQCRRGQG